MAAPQITAAICTTLRLGATRSTARPTPSRTLGEGRFHSEINRISGSTLIPLGDIPRRYVELDPSDEIVVQCKVGGRSAHAAKQLAEAGIKSVANLSGGILAWRDEIDPSLPRY